MIGPAFGLSQVANGVLEGMDSARQENQRQANVDREFGLRQQAQDRAQSVTDAQLGQIQRANEAQDASLAYKALPVDPAITAHIFQGHGMTDPSQPHPDQPQATGLVPQAAPAAGDTAATPDADTGDDDGGDDATDGSPDADTPAGADAGVQAKQALTLSEGPGLRRASQQAGIPTSAPAPASTPSRGLRQQAQPTMPWDMLNGQAQQTMGRAQAVKSQVDALFQQHPEFSDRQKQIIQAQANAQIQTLVGQAQNLSAQAQGGQRAAYTKQAAAFLANGDVESATPYLQATGIDPRTFSGLQFEKGKDGTVTGRYLLPGGRILTQAMLQGLADPNADPKETVASMQKLDDLLQKDRNDQQQNAIEQGRLEVERRNASTNAYRASLEAKQVARFDPRQALFDLSGKEAAGSITPTEKAQLSALRGMVQDYGDKADHATTMALRRQIETIKSMPLGDQDRANRLGPLLEQLQQVDPDAAATYGTAVYDKTLVKPHFWSGPDGLVPRGWVIVPPGGNTLPGAPTAMAQAPTTGLRQGGKIQTISSVVAKNALPPGTQYRDKAGNLHTRGTGMGPSDE